jgi:hypothetical protein
MEALSFNIDNKKEFQFFKKNVFDFDNCIHYLFQKGKFLFWVSAHNGIVDEVAPSLREQLEEWNDNSIEDGEDPESGDYFVTDEEYEVHIADVKILNTPEYLKILQDKLISGNF